MTIIKNSTIFQAIEKWAPKSLAYEWDNVGLQIGSYQNKAMRIMITLDVVESVVDEAIDKNIDLIIAHHPLLFKPLKQIDFNSPKGKIIHKLIRHNISVYAAHTNLDIANGGVNDMLCHALSIKPQKNVLNTSFDQLVKLVVFIPETHVEAVREALSNAGAGHIGNYSHCTFQSVGQGTFKPLKNATPYIGTENQLTFVNEVKLETIISNQKVSSLVQAMIKAHPYEEPAYDIIPLENKGTRYGLGKIGVLEKEMRLKKLATQVKETFAMPNVRVTGNLDKVIKKVAIVGGSGEKYINNAAELGVDVLITGDMTFHTAQDALEMGLSVIDAGHYIEKVMKESVKAYLDNYFKQTDLVCLISETNTDPFQFV